MNTSLIFICFDLFWFDSNLRRICSIELLSELGTPILERFQKNFGFCVFAIRSFKFLGRRWRTVYPRARTKFIPILKLPRFFSHGSWDIAWYEKRAIFLTFQLCNLALCQNYNHISTWDNFKTLPFRKRAFLKACKFET